LGKAVYLGAVLAQRKISNLSPNSNHADTISVRGVLHFALERVP
jgi:hypothetical protein